MKFGGTPSNEGGEGGGIKRGKGGSRVGRAQPTKLLPDTRMFFSDASPPPPPPTCQKPLLPRPEKYAKKGKQIRGGVKNETGGRGTIQFFCKENAL